MTFIWLLILDSSHLHKLPSERTLCKTVLYHFLFLCNIYLEFGSGWWSNAGGHFTAGFGAHPLLKQARFIISCLYNLWTKLMLKHLSIWPVTDKYITYLYEKAGQYQQGRGEDGRIVRILRRLDLRHYILDFSYWALVRYGVFLTVVGPTSFSSTSRGL